MACRWASAVIRPQRHTERRPSGTASLSVESRADERKGLSFTFAPDFTAGLESSANPWRQPCRARCSQSANSPNPLCKFPKKYDLAGQRHCRSYFRYAPPALRRPDTVTHRGRGGNVRSFRLARSHNSSIGRCLCTKNKNGRVVTKRHPQARHQPAPHHHGLVAACGSRSTSNCPTPSMTCGTA